MSSAFKQALKKKKQGEKKQKSVFEKEIPEKAAANQVVSDESSSEDEGADKKPLITKKSLKLKEEEDNVRIGSNHTNCVNRKMN